VRLRGLLQKVHDLRHDRVVRVRVVQPRYLHDATQSWICAVATNGSRLAPLEARKGHRVRRVSARVDAGKDGMSVSSFVSDDVAKSCAYGDVALSRIACGKRRERHEGGGFSSTEGSVLRRRVRKKSL